MSPRARIEVTYGSWNTHQILGDINSGAFLHGKAHFWLNGDYQSSDGYQTFSPKQDVAATAKFDYKFSDRTYLSVIGTDIILDAFNNNDPTRRQLFHHGDNYLYDNTVTNAGYGHLKYYYDPQFWRYLGLPRASLLRHRHLQPRLRQGLEARLPRPTPTATPTTSTTRTTPTRI